MPEYKQTELKTLCFMKGPFSLDSYAPQMKDSAFKGRERYEVGLELKLTSPLGVGWKVLLPKYSKNPREAVVYNRFSAMMNDNPKIKVLEFEWDDDKGQVLITPAANLDHPSG